MQAARQHGPAAVKSAASTLSSLQVRCSCQCVVCVLQLVFETLSCPGCGMMQQAVEASS